MATQVSDYHVLVYGSPDGYQTNRAQISVYGANGKVAAYIRFQDPGQTFENDYEKNGIIRMHLPTSYFQGVLDVLRNEDPVQIYFAQNRGFLSTSKEPVGEGE